MALLVSRRSSFSKSSITSSVASLSSPCSPRHDTVTSGVPFLWEEKPGVLKQNRDFVENVVNSMTSPEQPELLHIFMNRSEILPLRTPPRLQKPSYVEGKKAYRTNFVWQRNERKMSHSDSISKKHQTRKQLRAEDDPFVMAFRACMDDNSDYKAISEAPRRQSRARYERLFEIDDGQSARKLWTSQSHSFGEGINVFSSLRHLNENVCSDKGISRWERFSSASPKVKREKLFSAPRTVNCNCGAPTLGEIAGAASRRARASSSSLSVVLKDSLKLLPAKEMLSMERDKQRRACFRMQRCGARRMLARCLGCKNSESYGSIVRLSSRTSEAIA